jgi:hypothetical protein
MVGAVANVTMMTTAPDNPKVVGAADVTGIALSQITVGARKRPLDPSTVERLKADILAQGLLQPIGVRATTGKRGGPYQLIYGHHRYTAFCQLGDKYDGIPAVIFPPDTPDWQIELAEITENFVRRELTPNERDEHTLRAAVIYKRNKLVITADEKKAENGASGGRGNVGGKSTVTVGHSALSKQTVTEKLSNDLGINKKTAHRRVAKAAKGAGMSGVTLEKATADELEKLADHVAASSTTPAAKVGAEKSKVARAATADVEAAIGAIEAEDIMETDEKVEAVSALLTALDLAEDVGGIPFAQAVIRKWWLKREPKGEVRFNPVSYGKATKD